MIYIEVFVGEIIYFWIFFKKSKKNYKKCQKCKKTVVRYKENGELKKPGCPSFVNSMLDMSGGFLVLHFTFLFYFFMSQNFNYKVLKNMVICHLFEN